MNTQSRSSYNNIYGVQLLDDLHNYFPELLYNQARFLSVQDVLGYIGLCTQRRFNLYNYGRELYNANRAQHTTPAGHPEHTMPSAPIFTFNTAAPLVQTFQMDDHDLTANVITGLADLLPLLGISTIAPATVPRSFMDPIIVRPSAQHIHQATHITTLDAPIEGACSICQDSMNTGQSVRSINQCGHVFHMGCIDTWFTRSCRCPICRIDIREPTLVPNTQNNANGGAGAGAGTNIPTMRRIPSYPRQS